MNNLLITQRYYESIFYQTLTDYYQRHITWNLRFIASNFSTNRLECKRKAISCNRSRGRR